MRTTNNKKGSVLWWVIAILVLGIIAGLVALHFWPQLGSVVGLGKTAGTTDERGLNEGGAPWPAETAHLKDRLIADNLAVLSEEGQVLHIHQHLDIILDGIPLQIPEGIGINESQNFISPIHVHDLSGIVHVESPTVQDFTLGQFFDVWGVAFSATRMGGYYNVDGKTLQVYVNGEPYQGDPRALVLGAHQEIAIIYGTASEVPKTIPSTFTFPVGY